MGLIITGGSHKGHRLRTDRRSTRVRPTSSKVRQALFNSLAARVPGCRFADLYAGSGAVGLEAWSRGAGEVWLVEKDPVSLSGLKANCALLQEREAAGRGTLQVTKSDAKAFCARAEFAGYFDMVFADPPFREDFNPLWELVGPLVKPGGCAVLQFPSRARPAWLKAAVSVKKYGESSLAYFRPERADPRKL